MPSNASSSSARAPSHPSSTRMLADRIAAEEPRASCARWSVTATTGAIELGPLAVDVARAVGRRRSLGESSRRRSTSSPPPTPIIAATPVYKAGISGLFKSFVDVLDNDLLDRQAGRCSPRPAAAPATRSSSTTRCARCSPTCARSRCRPRCSPRRRTGAPPSSASASSAPATELAVVLQGRIEQADRRSRAGPATSTSSPATRPAPSSTAADVDFDSPLMRLAAGGRAD